MQQKRAELLVILEIVFIVILNWNFVFTNCSKREQDDHDWPYPDYYSEY